MQQQAASEVYTRSNCWQERLWQDHAFIKSFLRYGWLDYNNLQIFGKSLFQPEYKIIKKAFKEKLHKDIIRLFDIQSEIARLNVSPDVVVKEIAKNWAHNPANIECQFFETSADVPDLRELSSEKKNLIIFDNLQLEKQDKCETYYIRGRHSNVDCFYLAQNYCKLPRQTIRENANFISLFPQDQKMFIILKTTTCQRICQRKISRNCAKRHGDNHTGLLLLI